MEYRLINSPNQYIYSNTKTSIKSEIPNMASMLFQPKMLFVFILVWFLLVGIGSGTAILLTENSFLSDSEVEAIISQNKDLALTAGVTYSNVNLKGSQNNFSAISDLPPAYPDRLIIPKLGKDLPVTNPKTRNIKALDKKLTSSVVRYPGSATLGEKGRNVLIFGHSSNWPVVRNQMYKAFTGVDKLKKGDLIQAISGNDVYSYRVSRVYRADAKSDRIALSVSGPNRLTLLTCDTFGKRSDRWVVEADFVGKNI